jgi:predicted aconitase
VCLGTPHYSAVELERLVSLLDDRQIDPAVDVYVSTGRATLARLDGELVARLESAGVRIVVDTCTYITPILRVPGGSTVMTDSAKWAWYAPGNLGVEVLYASAAECVESALTGKVVRNRPALLDG